METTNLWSLRFSTAKGWHWKLERECSLKNAPEWYIVFTMDEPDVHFKLQQKKPKNPKGLL